MSALRSTLSLGTFLFVIAVAPVASAATSDDFSGSSLNEALWGIVDPVGDSTVSVDGTRALLSVPSGSSHDVWVGGNNSARIMQPVSDADFGLEVKFESSVSQRYQLQGLLVEQDVSNFVRLDVYSDGSIVRAFMATFSGGAPSVIANLAIGAAGQPVFLRLSRLGNSWLGEYSNDGSVWNSVGTTSFAIQVQSAGVFAGNAGPNPPAHTAIVDYFFDTATPIVPEDGSPSYSVTVSPATNGTVGLSPAGGIYQEGTIVSATAQPEPGFEFGSWTSGLAGTLNPESFAVVGDITIAAEFVADETPPTISDALVDATSSTATISWTTDELTTGLVQFGTTPSYELGSQASAGLDTQHSVTLVNLLPEQQYHFAISATDQASISSSTPDATLQTDIEAFALQSDDFSSTALDTGIWTFVDPIGDAQQLLNGSHLVLDVPAGTHDIWVSGNDSVRVMQPADDEDFEVEVKFATVPQSAFQIQGIVVEEDADTFMRVDFYSDGNGVFLYAASLDAAQADTHLNIALPQVPGALFLQAARTGSSWTVRYSLDGQNWIAAPAFVSAVVPNQIGVFAANAGPAPAYTAVVDYFFDTSVPIVPEDGGLVEYSVSATAVNGSIALSPLGGIYVDGTSVQATAVAQPGFGFVAWSGDLAGVNNPETFLVDGPKTISAFFSSDQIPPVISDVTVTPSFTGATVTWTTDEPTTGLVRYGQTSSHELGSEDSLVLATTHAVVIGGLDQGTLHHIEVVATDSVGNQSAAPDQTFITGVRTPSLVSDDFFASSLNSFLWSVEDPLQDGSVSLDGTQLLLQIPNGVHDIWSNANNSLRITQPASNVDFGFEAKFASVPTRAIEIQGVIVQEAPGKFLRFDFYHDGSDLRVFSASIDGTQAIIRADEVIPIPATELFIRVDRTSDDWSLMYSVDGQSWASVVTFNFAMVPTQVGPFAASSGSGPGFTAIIDYFFDTAAPISPEDTGTTTYDVSLVPSASGTVVLNPAGGTYPVGTAVQVTAVPNVGNQFVQWGGDLSGNQNPELVVLGREISISAAYSVDNTAPQISSVVVTPGTDSATITWTTSELTTGQVNFGETASYELGSEAVAGLALNHIVFLTGLPGGTDIHYQIEADDQAGNTSLSPDAVFSTDGIASSLASDDFFASSINAGLWTVVDPIGDGLVSVDGERLQLFVPGGVDHDVWVNGIEGVQLLQPSLDEDFEVEIKFESVPTQAFSIQGLLVKQDDLNAIRFDFTSAGGGTRVFAATIENGVPSAQVNQQLGFVQGPLYLKVRRLGDTFTLSYSFDGLEFLEAVSFSHALSVSQVGLFAGNAGGASSPAFAAVVDYFRSTADILNPEDGVSNYSLATAVGSGSGSIVRSPAGSRYDEGTSVQLVAVPDPGWFFAGWQGDVQSSENPVSVAMNADLSVQAAFAIVPTNTYDLDTLEVGNGQVVLNPAGGSYLDGTLVNVTAEPAAGYAFAGWTGDIDETDSSFDLVVNRDYSLTATFVVDTESPAIKSVQASTDASGGTATISWLTNENADSRVEYGLTTAYELGSLDDPGFSTQHSLTISGLQTGQSYQYRVISTDQSGFTTESITHTFQMTQGPVIDVWYGFEQSFGLPGQPQQWLNVIGNFADPGGLSAHSFSLNGGPSQPLDIGPFRRLADPGDFNVEIDYADLIPGTNTVAISATDGQGNTTVQNVLIGYTAGNQWPLPFEIDWSSQGDVTDVADAIDGIWDIRDGKLRNELQRYDRNILIGDVTWDEYEVLVPITIRGFSQEGFDGVNFKPAVGVMLKWPGHTNWTGDQQPSWGYYPAGGAGWYEFDQNGSGTLYIRDFQSVFAQQPNRNLELNTSYLWRVRVQKEADDSSSYFVKVWKESDQEPAAWDLQENDTNDVPGGALLILAHFTDIEVGNVSITPLIDDAPTAEFTVTPEQGIAPLSVSFDARNSVDIDGTIVSYDWDFGDGSTGSGEQVTHVYAVPGVYDVTLVVTDNDSLQNSTTQTVTATDVNGNVDPVAIAITDPTTGSLPLSVSFDGSGSFDPGGSIVSYAWDFGDGAQGSGVVTNHTYTQLGVYEYSLTVTDNGGGSDTVTGTVTVSDRVTAGLISLYEMEEGAGDLVRDTAGNGTPLDLTISNAQGVTWVPGALRIDQSNSIASSGAATKINSAIIAAGEFTVEAWIASQDLNQNGPARIVSLSQSPATRNFTLGQGVYNQGGDRLEVRVRTTTTSNNGIPASNTPNGTLTTNLHHVVYTMDGSGVASIWIDGVLQSTASIGGNLSNWNSAYPLIFGNEASGDRPWLGEIHLVAFYDRALSQVEIAQNEGAGPSGTGMPSNFAPEAMLSADTTNGIAPLLVSFDASGSTDDFGIVSYDWDFGDGTSDSGSLVTHSFTTPGTFTVSLIVTDAQGLSDTESVEVVVASGPTPPTAVASADVVTGPAPLTVNFDASGSSDNGTITAYQWDFGDGSTDTGISPTHTFAAEGAYVVTLTVTDDDAEVGIDTLNINANTIAGRVDDGLLALYEFEEGAGSVVADTSNSGTPMNLTVLSGSPIWQDGALIANSSTLVTSSGPAAKVIQGVKTSNQLTLEAWISTNSLNQNGPARIVSLGSSPLARNLTLGQGVFGSTGDRLETRLRTTSTSQNGTPGSATPVGSLADALTHVVYTRDTQGSVATYINGQTVATGVVAGDLSSWNNGYVLSLFNEATGDRPWLGELHLVAIYDRALTVTDIAQNLEAGPSGDGTNYNVPPIAFFNSDVSLGDIPLLVQLDATASQDLDGVIATYDWDFGDGVTATGPITNHSFITAGTFTVSLTVTDNEGAQSTATKQIAATDPNNLPEILVFDWNEPVTQGDRGFPWNEPPMASANGDWTAPIDYSTGRLHMRVEVFGQPVSQDMRLQFCVWQYSLTLETCTSTRRVQGNPGNVVTWSNSIPAMWMLNGMPIEWDNPRQRYSAVIKNSNLDPVSNFNGWNWFGEDPTAWYPLDMRFTVVVVPEGQSFSGWENYID